MARRVIRQEGFEARRDVGREGFRRRFQNLTRDGGADRKVSAELGAEEATVKLGGESSDELQAAHLLKRSKKIPSRGNTLIMINKGWSNQG